MKSWFVFNEGNLYVIPTHEGFLKVPDEEMDSAIFETVIDFTWLDGSECKAVKVDNRENLHMGGLWMPLRMCFGKIPANHYRCAGKAAELLDWDSLNQYCGHCGTKMRISTPISKYCPVCQHEVWAKLSPAIIVLISKGEEVLLVQSKSFKRDYYGLISGFVEMGETLEECLHREVWEETHLKVENVRYFGSQAWPFPRNLMAGFYADYKSGELKLQDEELRKGGWFHWDNLPPIPEKDSIARRLIDSWRSSFL